MNTVAVTTMLMGDPVFGVKRSESEVEMTNIPDKRGILMVKQFQTRFKVIYRNRMSHCHSYYRESRLPIIMNDKAIGVL